MREGRTGRRDEEKGIEEEEKIRRTEEYSIRYNIIIV